MSGDSHNRPVAGLYIRSRPNRESLEDHNVRTDSRSRDGRKISFEAVGKYLGIDREITA